MANNGAADTVAPVAATTDTAPAPVGEVIRPLDFTIVVPDIRNGAIRDIQQAAPKASIDAAWKWAAVDNLPAERAVDCVEYYIRGAYAVLVTALGNAITDPQRAEARRKALVLGAIRAGAHAAYRLTAADFTPTELTQSGYAYVNGRIAARAGNGTVNGRHALAVGMPRIEPVEVELISAMVYLGMAVPVLQGVSLVNSGHHFLPTTKNIFDGQRKQALGLLHEPARALVDAMGATFDDMAFHKACHPISPPVKRRLAKDPEVPARLIMSGHGATAIRLPAVPSDAAIGKAGVALIQSAKPTIQSMGHHVDVTNGIALIRDLEQSAEGAPERAAVVAIQDWAAAQRGNLAFCAGIVQHVHEALGTGRHTLLNAYSVKKVMSDGPADVQRGVVYARVAAANLRRSLEDGSFADPNIMA